MSKKKRREGRRGSKPLRAKKSDNFQYDLKKGGTPIKTKGNGRRMKPSFFASHVARRGRVQGEGKEISINHIHAQDPPASSDNKGGRKRGKRGGHLRVYQKAKIKSLKKKAIWSAEAKGFILIPYRTWEKRREDNTSLNKHLIKKGYICMA